MTAVESHGELDAGTRLRVERAVADHKNLGDVLAWGANAAPPRGPAEVITQDEYTHDVIMRFQDGVYVVYDVT